MSELATREPQNQMAVVTPMELIQRAQGSNASVELMRDLMDMQERWERNEARKAYLQAMADFKNEHIRVYKDKENKQYGSRYTSIGNLVNTVTPVLAKYGLSAEWHMEQSDGIKIGCTITHALGHSGETKWMKVPLDTSGAKNPLQQLKSSQTYARICTFEMACGIASEEGSLDDDGNGAGPRVPEDRMVEIIENIRNASTTEELLRISNAAYKEAKAIGDKTAIGDIIQAKDKRKAEL